MKKLKVFLSFFVFSITVTFAQDPCDVIAEACKKAGYYQGGMAVHKGLIADCMFPVVNRNNVIPLDNFSDEQLRQCKVALLRVFKEKNRTV